MPKRIRLSRVRGYRFPEGAVVVSRPSRRGNPFTVARAREIGYVRPDQSDAEARAFVADCFDSWITKGPQSPWWFADGKERYEWIWAHMEELRGRDLACWCDDDHCHVLTYLRLANA